jgi:DnaJ-class molecular chaperone
MEKKNWYAVLCIDRYSSSESDIQRAYRRQALILHPDRNPEDPNASNKFLELKEAYGNSLLSVAFLFLFRSFQNVSEMPSAG